MTSSNISTFDLLQLDMQELLATPAVVDRLGDYAIKLSGVTDRLIHTEVDSNGFMQLDQEQSNRVPFLLRHMGKRAILHAYHSGMNSEQANSLRTKLGNKKAVLTLNETIEYFADNQLHRELHPFNNASELARTGSNFWLPDSGVIVYGRPYISMNLDARAQGKLSPVVALHELTHVLQREEEPIRIANMLSRDKIRSELEAYHVAAQVILGMKDADRLLELLGHTPKNELQKALKIERIRLISRTDSDSFDPSNQVIKSLVDQELGITAEISEIIRDRHRLRQFS